MDETLEYVGAEDGEDAAVVMPLPESEELAGTSRCAQIGDTIEKAIKTTITPKICLLMISPFFNQISTNFNIVDEDSMPFVSYFVKNFFKFIALEPAFYPQLLQYVNGEFSNRLIM